MKKIFLITLLPVLFLYSCKKNQLGGKSTVTGVVAHHNKKIPNAVVYIKFNATEFPGADVNSYDTHIQSDVNGSFSFMCYKGDYYLYAIGNDFDIKAPYIVKGGVPVSIRNNEKVDVIVAVTED
jgi:hypothetical protein